jgi:enterochelin esterase-like enzyme
MKRIIFFALFILLTPTQSKALEITSSEVKSEILNQTRSIQVYLPPSYVSTKQVYPVLYVIDGQRYFLHGVTFQKTLRFVDKSPEFIIVGIDTDIRKRRDLLGYQSAKFLGFMKSELIPYIDEKYRTSKERILFGWEMAGGFATQVMAETDLFSTYLIASPTHITKERIDAITPKIKAYKKDSPFLFLTQAEHEPFADEFNAVLTKIAPTELNWKYTRLVNDDHHTTPYQTIYQGLRELFNDYPPIKFYTLKDFYEFGGMEKLKERYQSRGQRYDISMEINDKSQFSLLRSAIREDNLESFDEFLTKFPFFTDGMLFPAWGRDWAEFYMKHQEFDKAKTVLVNALNLFPEAASLHANMSDALVGLEEQKNAKKHIKKAIELAVLNKDPRVDLYKQKLTELCVEC